MKFNYLIFIIALIGTTAVATNKRSPSSMKKSQVVICGQGSDKDSATAVSKSVGALNKTFIEGRPGLLRSFEGAGEAGIGIDPESISAPSISVVQESGRSLAFACVTVTGQLGGTP